jgi:hypothetical protein
MMKNSATTEEEAKALRRQRRMVQAIFVAINLILIDSRSAKPRVDDCRRRILARRDCHHDNEWTDCVQLGVLVRCGARLGRAIGETALARQS